MAELLKEPYLWLRSVDLETELRQLEDEGREVASLEREFRRLIALGDDELWKAENQEKAVGLLDAGQALPTREGYRFEEPSDLPSIKALTGKAPESARALPDDGALRDKILGAWLGRCAGCLLGKPVEGKRSGELRDFLSASGQWPLRDYIHFDTPATDAFPGFAALKPYDTLDHMPVDDDTDYTVLAFRVMREKGASFTPADVARRWLRWLPLLRTYTAERAAYRNFALHIQPPASASYRNPYREWIGAQIRADAYGYVCAGNPERAAEFAWRDASISHVKNGIYGAMFVASMVAAAAAGDDVNGLIEAGLAQVPETSRLHAEVREVLRWRASGLSYDEAAARIHERWDEHSWHHWTHAISNAAVCVVAVLWGEKDFGQSVCRAVQMGFDTDCNGATVGSIMGMMLGAKRVPERWTERLHNTLKTSLLGYESVEMDSIAGETADLCLQIKGEGPV